MIPINHVDVFSFIPREALSVAHWMGCFIVFCEALNKLERSNVFMCNYSWPAKVRCWFSILGWTLLAFGAGGALITPLLHLEPPTLQDAAFSLGSAFIIIAVRVAEALTPKERAAINAIAQMTTILMTRPTPDEREYVDVDLDETRPRLGQAINSQRSQL